MTPASGGEVSLERSGSAVALGRRSKLSRGARPAWPLLDPPRLRQLCEISKLLIRSGSAETTIPAVVGLIHQVLPLRSAIFILCERVPVWVVWSSAEVSSGQLGHTKAIAQRCYDYFMGGEVTPYLQGQAVPERLAQASLGTLVCLPLVVEHSGSMGLCQLEGLGKLDEIDLELLSAVAVQLALALDRQAITERQRNIAERRRSDAVEHQIRAEARLARTEAEARAAKAERLRTELGRATAEALQDQAERQRLLAEDVRDRYRALVDNAEGAFLWEADANTLRMSYVSAGVEDLLGFPRLRWLGEPLFLLERVYPDERAALTELMRKVQDGADQRCEHRFVSEDGRVVWFHTGVHRSGTGLDAILQGISLRLAAGPHVPPSAEVGTAPATRQGLHEDVDRGRRAVQDRDELLASVSHDLKSPLSVILMTVERMTSGVRADSTTPDLANIQRSALRMDRLVRDLLDSARLQAGRLPIEPLPVAPGTLVDEAIAAMLPLARAKGVQLESLLGGDVPEVQADASRVQQVLANLIGNAIKFSLAGGDIVVRADRVGRYVRFAVRDIGSGIPAAELPHLFDRFWQAKRTVRHGTGLGLSIARGIVLAHGGRVWVQSRIGVGSTFYFTLPVV